LGLEIDPEKSWDEQKQQWLFSGKIVKTMNITQSYICTKKDILNKRCGKTSR
jgi:arginine decarboxylase